MSGMLVNPIAGGWVKGAITVTTVGGIRPVECWRHRGESLLAVTGQLEEKSLIQIDERWVITHVPTGVRLWPNDFALTEALSLCAELLRLPGWERWPGPDTDRLVAAANEVARRYVTPTVQ